MLAEALSRLHGPSIIRNESNGYHIYLPCPECLDTDGRKEIFSKHLTINASRYKQTDDWIQSRGIIDDVKIRDFSAVCHKNDVKYKVSDLLNERKFKPLEKRGFGGISSKVIPASTSRNASLVDDGRGNMVPMDPGEVIPITSLPAFHPAVVYLKERGYDINLLYKQFKCSFCIKENPSNPMKGIFYKRLPLGFTDTPQGRIIFYAFVNGVQVGWQARIIDRVEGDKKFYLHPYTNNWVHAEQKNAKTNKWEAIPGIEIKVGDHEVGWHPSKYKTAFGMPRNDVVMGIDAAVDFNKRFRMPKPVAFIVEGPLDAGRIGPGGVALLGKYMSERQADLLLSKFKKLVIISDNDKAGAEYVTRIKNLMCDRLVDVVFVEVPSQYKDIGDMTTSDAVDLVFKYAY